MTIWPDHRLLDLLGIELPIILAPMAGSGTAALAIAVAEAGGLGSLACALLGPDQARVEFAVIRQGTSRPINMNFFCHAIPTIDAAREDAWLQRLRPYFVESPSARTDRATDRGSADDAQRSFHGKGSTMNAQSEHQVSYHHTAELAERVRLNQRDSQPEAAVRFHRLRRGFVRIGRGRSSGRKS